MVPKESSSQRSKYRPTPNVSVHLMIVRGGRQVRYTSPPWAWDAGIQVLSSLGSRNPGIERYARTCNISAEVKLSIPFVFLNEFWWELVYMLKLLRSHRLFCRILGLKTEGGVARPNIYSLALPAWKHSLTWISRYFIFLTRKWWPLIKS